MVYRALAAKLAMMQNRPNPVHPVNPVNKLLMNFPAQIQNPKSKIP
jgi:hypothetical protein